MRAKSRINALIVGRSFGQSLATAACFVRMARCHVRRSNGSLLVTATMLSAEARRVHRALLGSYLEVGETPDAGELARASGVTLDTVPVRCRELAHAGYIHFDAARRLTCLFPFSTVPTPYLLTIDGERRYAMCAVDALGVSAMIGQPIIVDSVCAYCRKPIHLVVLPDRIAAAEPAEIRLVIGRDRDIPAGTACCQMTQFTCDDDCARLVAERVPSSDVLRPADAFVMTAMLFGSFLTAESLPASFPAASQSC